MTDTYNVTILPTDGSATVEVTSDINVIVDATNIVANIATTNIVATIETPALNIDILPTELAVSVALYGGTGLSTTNNFAVFSDTNGVLIKDSGVSSLSFASAEQGNLAINSIQTITATSPIASSGGKNPILSISAATDSVDGYLSSVDHASYSGHVNATASNPHGSRLSDQTDTNIVSPANNNILRYKTTTGKWINEVPGFVTNVSASVPLSSTGGITPIVSISQATPIADGFLSHEDWNTFNNKIDSVIVDSPLVGNGTILSHISIPQATSVTSGYLSYLDRKDYSDHIAILNANPHGVAQDNIAGYNVIDVSSTYTAVVGDYINADATAGAFTITTPALVDGKEFYVRKMDASANVITVAGKDIKYQGTVIHFMCDGTSWSAS